MCPHMKKITLPKILDCLENETGEIIMDQETINKARLSVEKMVAIGRQIFVPQIKLSDNFIKNQVKLALNEDLYPNGDITSHLINKDKIIKVKLIANQDAVIGGLKFAKYAFSIVDSKIKLIIKLTILTISITLITSSLFTSAAQF